MCRFIFLIFVASVAANSCPAVTPVNNFDFGSFGQGIWYEVARYYNDGERDSDCGISEYKLSGGIAIVKNSFIRNNKEYNVEGSVKIAPDAGKSGKLVYSMPYGPRRVKVNSFLDILAVDYDNYIITYTCKYDEATNSKRDFAWLLSRSKTLSDKSKAEVDELVKNSLILDASRFEWPKFTEEACSVN